MTPLELSGLVTGSTLLVIAISGLTWLARSRREGRAQRRELGAALAASEAVSAALSEEAVFLSALLSAVDAVIVLADRDGRVRFVNERFQEIFGIRSAEVVGRSLEHLREEIAPCFADPEAFLQRAMQSDDIRWSEVRATHPAGHAAPDEAEFALERPARRALLWSRNVVAHEQKPLGLLSMFRDITARREAEKAQERLVHELAARATTDALTNLANRRAASETLSSEVDRARRYQRPLAVVLFDIDQFKRVNDDFGHEAGDLVLKVFAAVLKTTARSTDMVARWGGEEFLAILHEADLDAARAFAERVRTFFAAAQPLNYLNFSRPNPPRMVTVSGGIAVFSGVSGENADAMVRRADEGLYLAKRSGRDRTVTAPEPAKAPEGDSLATTSPDRGRRSRPAS
ncbi:MAG: hypothetical protein NVS3B20_16090 [Polyangiales bacterium]